LGSLPQCGFSVAAANLFASKLISPGTLMAVFLATSDEAIPILLAHPEHIGDIWKLIAVKFVIAVFFGILLDLLLKHFDKKKEETDFHELCHDCGCHEHGVLYSAVKHTAGIVIFILILNLALGFIVGAVGEEAFFNFIEGFGVFQPAAAALVGLIPNCASSVLLTELFIEGGLSFGSTVAGLSTGAGVGILVLFKANKDIKENILIVALLYVIGVLAGSVLTFIM
ncbi:MAG: arsenic efflux protein, partial [Ruminococcus sp.]|nr:arsenic efflux protein [Ruminococcus sp.]